MTPLLHKAAFYMLTLQARDGYDDYDDHYDHHDRTARARKRQYRSLSPYDDEVNQILPQPPAPVLSLHKYNVLPGQRVRISLTGTTDYEIYDADVDEPPYRVAPTFPVKAFVITGTMDAEPPSPFSGPSYDIPDPYFNPDTAKERLVPGKQVRVSAMLGTKLRMTKETQYYRGGGKLVIITIAGVLQAKTVKPPTVKKEPKD